MFQEFPSSTQLVEAAKQFFSKGKPEELPEVLTNKGHKWMVIDGKWLMALFCLGPEGFSQAQNFLEKGWDPFPALFNPSENEKGGNFWAGGKGGIYSSNTSGGGYAYEVKPKASFILHNHRHTFRDPEGKKITYIVELAFVVGREAAEPGESLENVFQSLFERLRSVWASSQ